jgi:hypothetical protein
MTKRKSTKPKLQATASAKAEVVAKATYQRKHSTTEVIPPDVTRAKAGAWLDFISPITEWAGLKGDELRSKRALFRVQQEETLLRVAEAVRKRIDGKQIKPVPPKILVPALEKASLEDPSDDAMIQRWAELLASASQDVAIQPRFVGILGELAGRQAACLETIAFNNYEKYEYPASDLDNCHFFFGEHEYRRIVKDRIFGLWDSHPDFDKVINRLAAQLNRPGVFPEVIMFHVQEPNKSYNYDPAIPGGRQRRESDLAILESLGLVRRVGIELDIELQSPNAGPIWVAVYYYHLTRLGVELCEVCSRKQIDKLKEIDLSSRASGVRRGSYD